MVVRVNNLDLGSFPWDVTEFKGWTDSAPIQMASETRIGHGAFTMPGSWGGRAVNLRGTVWSADRVEQQQLRDMLMSIAPNGEKFTVEVERAGRALHGTFQVTDSIVFDPVTPQFAQWELFLFSGDPFLYGEPRTVFAYPDYLGVGLVYPLFSGYLPPRPPVVDHYLRASSTFTDLSDLFNTGVMGAGGGASLSVSADWAVDGDTSLRVGPGSSRSSSAYVLPRNTPLDDWAGRWVQVDATVRLPSAMPDPDGSTNNPPAAIILSMDYQDGSTPFWRYAASTVPDLTQAGVYQMHAEALFPDDLEVYQGWFLRLFNGSQTIPVFWDDLRVVGQEVPRIEPSRSTFFTVSGLRVVQSFDIDNETGEYYLGHPMSTYENDNRVNLLPNPSFEDGLGQEAKYPGIVASSSGAATIAVDTAWAAQGGQSLRITPQDSGSSEDTAAHPLGGSTLSAMDALGILPGETYTVGATIHLEAPQSGTLADHARRVRINMNDGASTIYSWKLSEAAPNVAGDHRVSVTFTVPANAAGLNFSLSNGAKSGSVWWDAMTFEKGATDGSYFEGTIDSTSGTESGPMKANVYRRNLIPSPIGARSKSVGTWSAGSGATVATATQDGAPCVALTRSGDGFYWGLSSRVDLAVGQEYTLSADIKVTEDVTDARVRLADYHGASLTVLEGGEGKEQTTEDGWVRHHLAVRVDEIPTGGYFRPVVETATAPEEGQGLYFRRVLLADAATTAYFDGESAVCRWSGPQEASVSEQMLFYGADDGYFRRMSPEGAELDRMLVRGVGHLNDMAVERDEDGVVWIWTRWASYAVPEARIKYRPGVVDVGDLWITPQSTEGFDHTHFATYGDEIGTWIAIDGAEEFRVYDRAAYMEGDRTPKRSLTGLAPVIHAHQGFIFDEEFLYVHHGGSKGDAMGVWRYRWDGTDKLDPAILRTSGYGRGGDTTRNEAEGISLRLEDGVKTIVVGVSGGPGWERISSVHDFDPTQFDYRDHWDEIVDTPEEETAGGILTYGEQLQDPEAVVTNNGIANTYLNTSVVGTFPGGVTVTSSLGTGSLTYPWPLTEETPLQLDGTGTAWVTGANVTHLLSARDFSQLEVGPGETRSIYLEPLQGGSGFLQVEASDTYI